MKVLLSLFLLLSLAAVPLSAETHVHTIIPKPQLFQPLQGTFTLTEQTRFDTATPLAANALEYLQQQLQLNADYTIKEGTSPRHNHIAYLLDSTLKDEAYTLRITQRNIVIKAGSPSGFFYATVSLMQLMDHRIWSQERSGVPKKAWELPACYIEDAPRFRWRGMMLDSARNFFSVAYVKKFIDRMAQYKLNVFHWHLTDDEGWRLEIKAYPLLTEVGAKRGPGTRLPFALYPAMRGPKDTVQQGYYTQEEIRDVVAYAAKRSVSILPEIDTPAHAKAAVTAYPELLQDPGDKSRYTSVQKVGNNTMDPGLKSTYLFLDRVIEEVTALFPFAYIHLGGDEIPKGAWSKSPAVARLMQKEHLHNMKEVAAYFFTKMDRVLEKHDRKLIAWQEVRTHNSALRDDTVIMAWRGDGAGQRAAEKGQKVIMSPAQYLYFDQQYVKKDGEHGHTWAGPTDTKEVYSYDPTAALRSPTAAQFVQGVHGCLWSERALTESIADYLAWPRMLALSEVGWSPQEARHWSDFERRAFESGIKRLERQHVHYRTAVK